MNIMSEKRQMLQKMEEVLGETIYIIYRSRIYKWFLEELILHQINPSAGLLADKILDL